MAVLDPQVDPLDYYTDPEPLDLVVPLEEASTKTLDLQLPRSYFRPLGCHDKRIHAIYTMSSQAVSLPF